MPHGGDPDVVSPNLKQEMGGKLLQVASPASAWVEVMALGKRPRVFDRLL